MGLGEIKLTLTGLSLAVFNTHTNAAEGMSGRHVGGCRHVGGLLPPQPPVLGHKAEMEDGTADCLHAASKQRGTRQRSPRFGLQVDKPGIKGNLAW